MSQAGVDMFPHGMERVTGGRTMESTLQRLGNIETVPIGESNFVKPLGISYELDGKKRKWDMVTTHPSVGVVIYHKGRNQALLVRQFRPPVYISLQQEAEQQHKSPPGKEAAFTYELCAGIIDKFTSLEEIAADEVLEETGFRVDPKDVHRVASYHAAIGFSGSRHSMFFVEVDESMRVEGQGGGLQDTGEAIEILALPLQNVSAFIADNSLAKSPGCMVGLMWLADRLKDAQATPGQ